jgi:radical SAM protein with 4Fe4S-binding SPASM domain
MPAHRLPKFQRQVRNLVRLTDDLASGREEWQSHPHTLEYASNNVCNLRCRHCPQHDGVPLVKMERATSERILDEFLPEGGVLSPLALSEPFAGDMELYLAKCEEHDAFLNIVTNGTLLTEEKLRRVMPRVARFFVSIESHVKRDYEALRIGAKFEKVEANCRLAARVAKEHNVPFGFVTVFMQPMYRDLPGYVRWVHSLGGERILVLELLPTYPRYAEHRVAGVVPESELLAIRDEAIAVARELGVGLWLQMQPPLGGGIGRPDPAPRVIHVELAQLLHGELFRQHGHFCSQLATYVKVDLDGTVYPCCRCPDELKMGNVNESSLAEIWNGPRYRALRGRMQSGDLPECCRDCSVLVGNPYYRRPGEAPPGDEREVESL